MKFQVIHKKAFYQKIIKEFKCKRAAQKYADKLQSTNNLKGNPFVCQVKLSLITSDQVWMSRKSTANLRKVC